MQDGFKIRQNHILKIGRGKVHAPSKKQNWCAYFTLLFYELL